MGDYMKIRLEGEYKDEGKVEDVLPKFVKYMKTKKQDSWFHILGKELYADYQELWKDFERMGDKLFGRKK